MNNLTKYIAITFSMLFAIAATSGTAHASDRAYISVPSVVINVGGHHNYKDKYYYSKSKSNKYYSNVGKKYYNGYSNYHGKSYYKGKPYYKNNTRYNSSYYNKGYKGSYNKGYKSSYNKGFKSNKFFKSNKGFKSNRSFKSFKTSKGFKSKRSFNTRSRSGRRF